MIWRWILRRYKEGIVVLNRIARSAVESISEQKRATDLMSAGGVPQNSDRGNVDCNSQSLVFGGEILLNRFGTFAPMTGPTRDILLWFLDLHFSVME